MKRSWKHHKQVYFTSKATDIWATPQDFFDRVNDIFRFDVDLCATPENAKCPVYFTPEQDALKQTWNHGRTYWLNPPYGDPELALFIRKAHYSGQRGATVVCLIPTRHDTVYWKEWVVQGLVRALPDRLTFQGAKNRAPFPCSLVAFGPGAHLLDRVQLAKKDTMQTDISWCRTIDHIHQVIYKGFTFGWHGCSPIGPGCINCYALSFDQRLLHDVAHFGKNASRLIPEGDYWLQPYSWNRKAKQLGVRLKVFCMSMGDIMEDRPELDAPRWRIYELVESTPNLDWLFLTKRPENYAKFLPDSWKTKARHNLWLMTTVESQPYTYRLKELMKVPAVVYGVSVEPMLSPVFLPDYFITDPRAWVICGGESGAGVKKEDVRPMDIAWARALRDQTKTAGRPFHMKQSGWHDQNRVYVHHYQGRELDGYVWNEFPTQ